MHLPAFCPHCGNVFPSGIDAGGGTLVLIGCRSNCPRCLEWAIVPDGVYRALKEATATARELRHKPEALKAAGDLAKRTALGEVKFEKAVEQAHRIDPKLGRVFRRTKRFIRGPIALAAALATIGCFFLAWSAHESAKEAQAQTEAILRVLTEMQQDNRKRQRQEHVARQRRGAIPQKHGTIRGK